MYPLDLHLPLRWGALPSPPLRQPTQSRFLRELVQLQNRTTVYLRLQQRVQILPHLGAERTVYFRFLEPSWPDSESADV
jgi:hypothetical protein